MKTDAQQLAEANARLSAEVSNAINTFNRKLQQEVDRIELDPDDAAAEQLGREGWRLCEHWLAVLIMQPCVEEWDVMLDALNTMKDAMREMVDLAQERQQEGPYSQI